ncbi:MAG TPA: YEATS-associated helix-containing protein [Allosphingosinicella sp.]|jgi:hypothetical protein
MNANIVNAAGSVVATPAGEQFWAMTGIIAIIVLGGLIGGWGAHLLTVGVPAPAGGEHPSKLRFFILGVIAAACVPLFLSLVQSGIVAEMMSNRQGKRAESCFIFAGLCLVAALTARNFLDSLSKRVLRDLEKLGDEVQDTKRIAAAADAKAEVAEQKADGADEKVEAVAEVVDAREAEAQEAPLARDQGDDEPILEGAYGAPASASLNDTERQVLNALGQMKLRAATGVAKDAGIPISRIGEMLDGLAERGLAAPTTSPTTGGKRWKITRAGAAALRG